MTLNPLQVLTLQVQFLPTAAGAASGQLTISSNSASGGTSTVTLAGTGTTTSSPQTTPQLVLSATSLNFGSIAVNTPSVQTLTLTSSGTGPVTVNSATITGAGFTVVGSGLPVTLNPLQTATLQVQFLPTAAGAASGQLTISSNSASGGDLFGEPGRYRDDRVGPTSESSTGGERHESEFWQCDREYLDDAVADADVDRYGGRSRSTLRR